MSFATALSGERTIVLSGELDLAVRDQLARQFTDAARETQNVTVDLTAVSYMDSSAIGAMISLYRDVMERGGAFRVRARNNAAYRLLEIAGLTGILTIEIVP